MLSKVCIEILVGQHKHFAYDEVLEHITLFGLLNFGIFLAYNNTFSNSVRIVRLINTVFSSHSAATSRKWTEIIKAIAHPFVLADLFLYKLIIYSVENN